MKKNYIITQNFYFWWLWGKSQSAFSHQYIELGDKKTNQFTSNKANNTTGSGGKISKTILRVIPALLAGLYYTIQTLCLYVGLKQQSLTRVVIVGFWSILHLMAWLVGNSSLGLFKGTIDRYLNNNKVTKILAGIIPVVLAACLVTTIVIGKHVVPCVILNMAIGFPCIAAADSFADETISKMLSDKYFGVVQYIATSIVGKGLFALMADNINSNGNLIFYLGWVLQSLEFLFIFTL